MRAFTLQQVAVCKIEMEKLGLTLLLIFSICIQQCLAIQRVYYIAAVDVQWDYAPSGVNAKNGIALDSDP